MKRFPAFFSDKSIPVKLFLESLKDHTQLAKSYIKK